LLREFGGRFSDIDAIYRHALAAQSARVEPKGWKRLLTRFCRRFDSETLVLSFMSALDEVQVIDATTKALGGILPAHRNFEARHNLNIPAPAEFHLDVKTPLRDSHSALPAFRRPVMAPDTVKSTSAASLRHTVPGSSVLCSDLQNASLVEVIVDVPSPSTCTVRQVMAAHQTDVRHITEVGDVLAANNTHRCTTSTEASSALVDISSKGNSISMDDESFAQLPHKIVSDSKTATTPFSRPQTAASASTSLSASSAVSEFVKKTDLKSRRPNLANLKMKSRLPPDDTSVVSVQRSAGAPSNQLNSSKNIYPISPSPSLHLQRSVMVDASLSKCSAGCDALKPNPATINVTASLAAAKGLKIAKHDNVAHSGRSVTATASAMTMSLSTRKHISPSPNPSRQTIVKNFEPGESLTKFICSVVFRHSSVLYFSPGF
jgi:hypothetical protein